MPAKVVTVLLRQYMMNLHSIFCKIDANSNMLSVLLESHSSFRFQYRLLTMTTFSEIAVYVTNGIDCSWKWYIIIIGWPSMSTDPRPAVTLSRIACRACGCALVLFQMRPETVGIDCYKWHRCGRGSNRFLYFSLPLIPPVLDGMHLGHRGGCLYKYHLRDGPCISYRGGIGLIYRLAEQVYTDIAKH